MAAGVRFECTFFTSAGKTYDYISVSTCNYINVYTCNYINIYIFLLKWFEKILESQKRKRTVFNISYLYLYSFSSTSLCTANINKFSTKKFNSQIHPLRTNRAISLANNLATSMVVATSTIETTYYRFVIDRSER